MKRQEIFDIVSVHLMKQGKKSEAEGEGCLYRAPDGCKCAIGILIPDDRYLPGIEGSEVYQLLNDGYGVGHFEFLKEDDIFDGSLSEKKGHSHGDFLYMLQDLHDDRPVDKWYRSLELIAERENLSMDHLNKELEGWQSLAYCTGLENQRS